MRAGILGLGSFLPHDARIAHDPFGLAFAPGLPPSLQRPRPLPVVVQCNNSGIVNREHTQKWIQWIMIRRKRRNGWMPWRRFW